MSNCLSTLRKKDTLKTTMMSSLYTSKLQATLDPTYCVTGPADRNPEGKGVAIKYNNYTRYLNRMRKKDCKD
jgi:hypothetical protein